MNKKIKLIVYDFDGVMKDNKVYVDQNGKETVQVNRSEGLGISEIKNLKLNKSLFLLKKTPWYRLGQINLVYPACKELKIKNKDKKRQETPATMSPEEKVAKDNLNITDI